MCAAKRCTKCGITKEVTEFYKAKGKPLGVSSICKCCDKEKGRKYRQDNEEKIKERGARYRAENADREKARHAEYHASNKDLLNAKTRERYHRDLDKSRLKTSNYYHSNKKKESVRKARYYQDNKAHYNARVRARERKLVIRSWPEEREEIERFYANRPDGHHVDHEIPLVGKEGGVHVVSGLHVLANLRYLPASENDRKGCKINLDRLNGL